MIRTLGAVTAVVLVVALVAVLLPPGRTWVKAGALAADALDLPVPRPFAQEVEVREAALGGVEGDVYAPREGAPPVLLIPGATPMGRDDPRAVDVAVALARSDRTVFIPELELYDEDVVRRDVRRLVDATRGLLDHTGADSIVIAGISYGGSLAVIAAAEPAIADQVTTVVTFGSYADLVGVLQAITTGVSVVDGEHIPWPDPHPDAEDVLRDEVIGMLPAEQRELLDEALERGATADELPEPAATFLRLLENDDPERTYELFRELPGDARRRLERLSPVHVLEELRADLVVMHATDDPLVPYGEALRFAAHHRDAELLTLTSFGHVDIDATSPREWLDAVGDLRRVWRFAQRVLAPHEPIVPRR